MSENGQVETEAAKRMMLDVVDGFAALMSSRADPERDDEDIADALSAGLRALLPEGEVLRARFAIDSDGDLRLRDAHDLAALEALDETEESLFAAAAASDSISRHGHGGQVALLLAPLVLRGGVIDLFVLRATAAGGLSDTDARTFSVLLRLARAAVLGRETQDEARLDALTGCLNHGAMHAQLAKEVGRVERTGGRLACVMLDLDDFKAANEQHGHPVGDELLRGVAAAIAAECRTYDSCCRYGGDEFLVILPNSDMQEALAAAERLRLAVTRATVVHGGHEITVTATTGVAVRRTGEAPGELIARADQALLRGKSANRNDDRDR